MSKPNLANRGFTLIELIVSIAIVGILFSIAAPGWLAFANRQRVNSARDQVAQALGQAQENAQRSRIGYSLLINGAIDPATLTVRPTSATTGGVAEPLGGSQSAAGTLGIQTTGNVTRIDFNSKGELAETLTLPVTIAVFSPSNSNIKSCVIVETLLGAMRRESGSGCS